MTIGSAAAQMAIPGKFQVNPAGAATYSIPIAVPPGIAGMTPSLTLEYNSQAPNGILGMGWSLGGLPSITRCAFTIAQDGSRGAVTYATYNGSTGTGTDRFCLDGQRLVTVGGPYGANGTEYRTEVDSFSRVISHGNADNGSGWFEVHTKSGQIMQFGATADSQILAQGTSIPRAWAVNRVTDTAGNSYTVQYQPDPNGAGQAYPQTISYAGNAISFLYAGSRPDNILLYEAGSKQEVTMLLTNVRTWAQGAGVADYRLAYQQTPATRRSYLASVTLCDQASTPSCLPPTTIVWNTTGEGFTLGSGNPQDIPGRPPASIAQGDVNGDGCGDLIEYFLYQGTFHVNVMLSNCNGSYTLYPWTTSATNGLFGIGNVTLADVDGDGLADLVITLADVNGAHARVALANGQTFSTTVQSWDMSPPNWADGVSVQNFGDPPEPTYVVNWNFGVADVDGDGRADLIAYVGTANGLETYVAFSAFVNGAGNFGGAIFNLLPGFQSGSLLADINGDGRMDIVGSNGTGLLTAAISNGNGTFSMPSAGTPFCAPGWQIATGDLNGDGRTDLVFYRGSEAGLQIYLAISKGDGTFACQLATQINGNFNNWSVSLADLNGDGRADVVASGPVPGQTVLRVRPMLSDGAGNFIFAGYTDTGPGWSVFTPDINGDGRSDVVLIGFIENPAVLRVISFITPGQPLLATSFTTGLGATTTVNYVPLTASATGVYTKGSGAAYPQQDAQGALYVVNWVEAPTGIASPAVYTSYYGYVGARFDLSGRGFLGFQSIKTYDPQTSIFTATTFKQSFPFVGMVDREQKWVGSQLVNETDNSYQFFNSGGGQSVSTQSVNSAPYRVSLDGSIARSNDLDGTALPTISTSYGTNYDAFNNPLNIQVYASDGYSKTTINTYDNDTTNWFLGRLRRAQVNATAPDPSGGYANATRTSSFAYGSGRGLLQQEVIEPDTPALRLETDYGYDAFGNKSEVAVYGVDIATRTTVTSYAPANGSADGQFPTTVTNALGQSETWQYDLRFGKPTRHTGPNGLTTTWQYDTFGRKTLEVRPDTTQTQYIYVACNGGNCPCQPQAAYYVYSVDLASSGQQIGPDTYVHYDVLDREIMHRTLGFDGSHYNAIQTQYDGLGRVSQKSRPFIAGCPNPQTTPQVTTYTYDALGRVTVENLPDGHTITHGYHGLRTGDTNQNGQTRIVTKNSQGQVVSVEDAWGVTKYFYDPFGNVTDTVDATGQNVAVNHYDPRGRKISSYDADLGFWTFSYDTLGQVISQTDNKGQTFSFSHDLLGRLTQRVEPDMTASWVYDTAPNGIGKLASASATGPAAGSNSYQRNLAYDSLGRPCQVNTIIDGDSYVIAAGVGPPTPGSCNANAYDANGRLAGVTYPSGFGVTYGYTGLGYMQSITDATSGTGQTYWRAVARDAEMHLTQDMVGNGYINARTFDAATGRLTGIVAGSGNWVANFSYSYDGVGNMLSRADGNTGVAETFTYDTLNRVTSSTVNVAPSSLVKTFSYDSVGNLLTKSDVGSYTYPAPGQPRPHGVVSINGETVSATFTYDANGNQVAASGIGRTIAYNAANKPASIQQGALTLNFADDVDHQRYKQTVMSGSSITNIRYVDAFGIHVELVTSPTSGISQWNQYLMVGGSMVGVRIYRSDTGVSLRYFHQDHLGSIAVITNEWSGVVERDAYDAWGKRRFNDGNDDPSGILPGQSQIIRGFTGQEMLASVGLVHLNGRVYDPYIGRMVSADPVVGDPLNGQTWNRYSYVYNNPLAYADPTGYCPNCIGYAYPRVAQASGLMQLIGSFFQIAAGTICMMAGPAACLPFMPMIVGVTSFYTAGVTTGSMTAALRAGVVAAATALAFNAVGDITTHNPAFGTAKFFENVAGHALVGCASSAASGAKCGPGALSAAVTAFAGPLINQLPFQAAVLANATLGGLASIAGGGKFANGAVTAAFGYLFNQAGNVAQGRAAEDLWAQSVLNDGGEIMGRYLKYYAVDAEGNEIWANGKRLQGELDGLARSRDGVIDVAEMKNGPHAKFEGTQLDRTEYVRDGRIRFYGKAAEQARIDGQTLSDVAGERPIAYRYYEGPLGAPRATRQFFRFLFRLGRGGIE